MDAFSQQRFGVRLEWGLSAVEGLASEADCIVIIDVISFSTCVSLAVDKGARIYPWPLAVERRFRTSVCDENRSTGSQPGPSIQR